MLSVKSLLEGHRHAAGALGVVVQHPSPRDGLQHGPMATRYREESEGRENEAEFAEHRSKDRSHFAATCLPFIERMFIARGRGEEALDGRRADEKARASLTGPYLPPVLGRSSGRDKR